MPRLAGTLLVAVLAVGAGRAADPTRSKTEFFEKKVRPLLAERCFSCHSESAKKVKGGLTLDSPAGYLAGGDSGPAVVPGKPDESRLIEAVRYTNPDLQMPPKGKLSDAEVAVLSEWVKAGAVWPNAGIAKGLRPAGKISDADRQWWAFRPVVAVAPPAAGDGWARNEIDRFIAAKLSAAKLTPAPEAARAVLIRRLTYDLWGLPPTPEAIAAFEADRSPDAYEKLVERLLASPRYGERWARHWLDLVRYADSDGYRLDEYRPHAWRYRDYVVNALNADKPYDRFVKEQLAGDELDPGNPEALVATGYLRHWIYEYNQRDVRTQWSIILDDVTDTTADVFLGLGLQCARCHDHKFDPLLQKDYYRLQAFFANLLPREDLAAATDAEKAEHVRREKVWLEKTAAVRQEIAAIEAKYRAKAAEDATVIFPDDIEAMIRKPAASRTPLEHQLAELAYRQVTYALERIEAKLKGTDKEQVLALKRKLAGFDHLKPPPLPVAFAATDVGPVAPPTTIPKRSGGPIEPGVPTVLDEAPAAVTPLPNSTGRRSALANWLTQPTNPLTARVMVNRVWQQHFGRGLATNASDFGKLGEAPSHPELLDWLADRFVQDGWSLKSLHRRIVLSATYRQSADHPEPDAGKLADPENRLLWRAPVRRLDAEQVRDALFAVAGDLDLQAGGPGGMAADPRRSIYTRQMRNNRDPLLDVFDAPLGFQSTAARDTTTTPVQSLLLFNSPFLLKRAGTFADRLAREEPDEARRVDRAYRLAFGRPATTEEVAAAQSFIAEQVKRVDPVRTAAAAPFAAGKIPTRDGQAADVRPAAKTTLTVPPTDRLPDGDFTIEAFVLPRTVADSGAVRTIAARWAGSTSQPGWALGVTGKKSRRKPQTVVIQLVGKTADGKLVEEAVFSDHHVRLNKPYYVAAAVKLATKAKPGQVTFYFKDLSNDDEPLLTARVEHRIVGGLKTAEPLTLGGRGGKDPSGFDGLIDDVRLSATALDVDQLLYTREGTNKHTVGYWRFEPKPSAMTDAAGHGLDLHIGVTAPSSPTDVRRAAWADFCHVLLNASEFLYVE